jgi:hypothetical protein
LPGVIACLVFQPVDALLEPRVRIEVIVSDTRAEDVDPCQPRALSDVGDRKRYLILQLRGPIEHDVSGRPRGVFHQAIDEKPLAVAGHDVMVPATLC